MRICIVILMATLSTFAGTEADRVLRELAENGYQMDEKKAGFVETDPGEGQKLLLKHANFPKSPKFKKYWEHAPHNKEKWQGLNPWNKDRIAEAFLKTDMAQAFYSDLKKAVTMDCHLGMEKKKGTRGWSTKTSLLFQDTCSQFLFDRSVCLSRIGKVEEALQCNLLALRLLRKINVRSFDTFTALFYKRTLKRHRPQILKLILQQHDRQQLEELLAELKTHHISAVNRLSIENVFFQYLALRGELEAILLADTSKDQISTLTTIIILLSWGKETEESIKRKLTKLHAAGELRGWIDKEWVQVLAQLLILDKVAHSKKDYQQVKKIVNQMPKSYFGDGPMWISLFEGDFKMRTERDLIMLIVACRIYQLKHGRLAPDLQTLKKEMPDLPVTDPFTGKPYGYVISEKAITVFSVGPDGERANKIQNETSDDISISLQLKVSW